MQQLYFELLDLPLLDLDAQMHTTMITVVVA